MLAMPTPLSRAGFAGTKAFPLILNYQQDLLGIDTTA